MLPFLERAKDFQKKNTGPNPNEHTRQDVESGSFFGLPPKFFVESIRPVCNREENISKPKKNDGNTKIDEEMLRWTATVGRYTKVLAFVGIVGLVIAGLQWHELDKAYGPAVVSSNAAKDSASIAQSALIQTQRAFVTITDINEQDGIDRASKQINGWAITVYFENTGQTPMLNAIIFAKIDLASKISWDFLREEQAALKVPRIGVGPHGKFNSGAKALSDDVAREIVSGADYRLYGEVRYETVFKQAGVKSNQFCFKITIDKEVAHGAGIVPFGWQACENHNTQD